MKVEVTEADILFGADGSQSPLARAIARTCKEDVFVEVGSDHAVLHRVKERKAHSVLFGEKAQVELSREAKDFVALWDDAILKLEVQPRTVEVPLEQARYQ